jgi:hypothetical protein
MVNAWFNPTSYSPASMAQFQYSLAMHLQTNPASLQQLTLLNQFPQLGGWQQLQAPNFTGPAGYVPQPRIEFSGAPAGRGLQTNPEGWPQGSVRTAGGYTVVPEGKDAAWSVYGPNAKPGDAPLTRVWGDPHVNEKDGTRWDFTKNSNFRLPDGTNISVDTTSQTGQSVSSTLNITNGMDRVTISGIERNRPQTSAVSYDGYEYRAAQGNRDTFHLGGTADNQRWFLERDGRMQGEVTGARYDSTTNRYEQVVNGDSQYTVDPSLRPQFGSPAWGNQLRMEAVDVARRTGNAEYAHQVAQLMSADHVHGQLTQMLGYDPTRLFGGYGQFGGFPQMTYSVGNLFQLLALQEIHNQALANSRGSTPIMV